MEDLSGPRCQSCGMFIMKSEEFGTYPRNVKRLDYCIYCFKNGEFTEPAITFDQMVDRLSSAMVLNKTMSQEETKETARNLLFKLKRWQQGGKQ